MPSGFPVVDDDVHQFLWEQCDRLGRIKLNQKDLAAHYGVNKFTASRVISRMLDAGRMRKIANDKRNRGVFVVQEPAVWKALQEGPDEW